MGKMYMGILGGFSGTVGTVVGSTNKKGDDIIRVKSKRSRTANSEKQVQQQSKFGLVTGFMKPLNPLLKIGLAEASGDRSTYNFFCQQVLKEAVTGEAPDLVIDYSKIRLSEGTLGMVLGTSVEFAEGKAVVSWTGSTQNQDVTDRAVLVAWNVDNGEVSYTMSEYTRASKTGELLLPYAEEGDQIVCYLFFQSVTDDLKVSTSQFLGKQVV